VDVLPETECAPDCWGGDCTLVVVREVVGSRLCDAGFSTADVEPLCAAEHPCGGGVSL
jgi:hypothetical protein